MGDTFYWLLTWRRRAPLTPPIILADENALGVVKLHLEASQQANTNITAKLSEEFDKLMVGIQRNLEPGNGPRVKNHFDAGARPEQRPGEFQKEWWKCWRAPASTVLVN